MLSARRLATISGGGTERGTRGDHVVDDSHDIAGLEDRRVGELAEAPGVVEREQDRGEGHAGQRGDDRDRVDVEADLEEGLLIIEDFGSQFVVDGDPPEPVEERYAAAVDMLIALHSQDLPEVLPVAPHVQHKLPRCRSDRVIADELAQINSRLAFDAVIGRDYTLLLGVFIVTSIMVIAFNLLTDMVYTLVDPRISASG